MLAFPTCKSQIAAIGPRGDLDFVSTTPLHPQPEAQLVRLGTKPGLGQVRGPCNSIVDKKITQILRKWVSQIKEVPAFERPTLTEVGGPRLAQLDDVDDEIPF